ncbi:MAG TPA: ABC transporter permease [Polyangiaceae bacterium]|nr:ABC transporter permease [Polyangiaceae bacterium]
MASIQHVELLRADGSALQGRLFPNQKALRALRHAFQKSIAIVAFLAVWEIAPRLGLVEPAFLPPLSTVLASGWDLVKSGQLGNHVRASLSRSLLGFVLAIVHAVPLGLAIGWYRRFAEVVNPLFEALRNTAALALLPVFILVLGIGESSKIALVVYSCSWPILLNTITGVRNVDPLLIKSARTMGLSPFQLFRKVILPAAVPTIFVGIRLAGAYSLLVLVAAEMIGAKAGLGYLIIYAQYNFQIPYMYVGILSITLIGLLFNQALQLVERRVTRWKAAAETE